MLVQRAFFGAKPAPQFTPRSCFQSKSKPTWFTPNTKLFFSPFSTPAVASETQKSVAPSEDKFKIQVSSIIERFPACVPDLSPLEIEIEQYKKKREEEIAKAKGIEPWGPYTKKVKIFTESERRDRARYFPDTTQARPREAIMTKADLQNNRKSVQRHADKYLFLIVRNKNGGKYPWSFPSTSLDQEGTETVRQAARRGVTERMGDDFEVYYWGHGPLHYHETLFPQPSSGFVGTRNFFMLSLIHI
eukprot:TRINITY_DN4155_c0_g1_i2.p1 TRINITY_DN4155_c0_g1~~TRINITY_DN4155_c0_g1_i2.p1  ORF type:complete len:272 (-),score=63.61 TRINITY_DN4155_c0_g1_i2:47-784(-)